jgi:hypothetical protein
MDAFFKVHPNINTGKFEFNPMLVNLLHTKRFVGDGMVDPHTHLDFFDEFCDSFEFNAFTHDGVRHKLFTQSLMDKSHT